MKSGWVVVLGPSAASSAAPREQGDTVAASLQRLGARVASRSLFAEIDEMLPHGEPVQCLVVDGSARPDLAARSLRHARGFLATETVPALVAIPPAAIQSFDPSSGFADFIVVPCTPVELYARLRKLEWNGSEFANDERMKIGPILIDRASHEVTLDGRRVTLTAREFALLVFFAQNRDRMLRRDVLLARVWGPRYEGGARTVDIHVRRLRAKLGDAFPLETMRGAGYVLKVR